jgi:hypothetical protein
MLLRILNTIDSNTSLLAAAVIAEAAAIFIMNQRTQKVESYSAGPPPDLWFGFKELRLYKYLDSLGEDGRAAYLHMNDLDVGVYMWCYMLLFGSLLFRQCHRAGLSQNVSLIFPFAMCMDLVETVSFRHASMQFPLHLSYHLVLLASIANQLKWIGFASGLLLLVVLFVKNTFFVKELKSS